ncbi:MAG: hypothetical protein GTO16_11195 [Candidatus Aminicenantes bacterium]|nr:hypothetical protein [Candidatus Aminicenantes bacterium]
MPYDLCTIQKKKLNSNWEKSIFSFLVIFVLLFSCRARTINDLQTELINSSKNAAMKEESSPQVDQADFSSIDAIVKALYASITFREGEKPNLERLRSLFNPKAPFIRITADAVNKMDMDSFLSSFNERINTGAMRSFYEGEISRKTHAFGSIAQVFTTYIKGINTKNPDSMVRGINSIQLFHDGQRWWIGSILWQDETEDNRIPQKYLH